MERKRKYMHLPLAPLHVNNPINQAVAKDSYIIFRYFLNSKNTFYCSTMAN